MKTIKIEHETHRKPGETYTEDLSQWAANQLTRSDRDGQIEDLEAQVRNVARAVGVLLERLVQARQMTTAEFLQVAAPYAWPEPKFVEAEEIPS